MFFVIGASYVLPLKRETELTSPRRKRVPRVPLALPRRRARGDTSRHEPE
jgi:hypothetical protein